MFVDCRVTNTLFLGRHIADEFFKVIFHNFGGGWCLKPKSKIVFTGPWSFVTDPNDMEKDKMSERRFAESTAQNTTFFYFIMRSVNIFLAYYQNVVGQIRL